MEAVKRRRLQTGTKIDKCIVGPLQLSQVACRHGSTAVHANGLMCKRSIHFAFVIFFQSNKVKMQKLAPKTTHTCKVLGQQK